MHSKGNYKQGEMATLSGRNETTGKGLISRVYKQLMQLNTRKLKKKKKNQKVGRRPKQTLLQRRHTDGQQTHEKVLNITHY